MKLENLETEFLGRNIFFYKNIYFSDRIIPSNKFFNLVINQMIEKNIIKNGTIVMAEKQTAGKRNTWKKVVYIKKR
jgi:hypothetical protein